MLEPELQEHAAGLICLTGDERWTACASIGARRHRRSAAIAVEKLISIFGHDQRLCRIAAALPSRAGSPQPRGHRYRAFTASSFVSDQWSVPMPLPRSRALRCVHRAPPSYNVCRMLASCWRAIPSAILKSPQEMQELFADLPEAIANTVDLSSRLEFTLDDLGYEFPKYPVPEGETMMSFLRERTREGFDAALWTRQRRFEEPRPASGRTRTGADRKTRSCRIFPDRLGPGAVLPRAKHSGARTRLGGQQRGLLFARHYGGRSRRHGAALRALSLRRTRRVARHRSRSAQRRPARARHSICLPALRRARRGHDRQCHHLSQPHGAREMGKGLGIRPGDARQSFGGGCHLGIQRCQ